MNQMGMCTSCDARCDVMRANVANRYGSCEVMRWVEVRCDALLELFYSRVQTGGKESLLKLHVRISKMENSNTRFFSSV